MFQTTNQIQMQLGQALLELWLEGCSPVGPSSSLPQSSTAGFHSAPFPSLSLERRPKNWNRPQQSIMAVENPLSGYSMRKSIGYTVLIVLFPLPCLITGGYSREIPNTIGSGFSSVFATWENAENITLSTCQVSMVSPEPLHPWNWRRPQSSRGRRRRIDCWWSPRHPPRWLRWLPRWRVFPQADWTGRCCPSAFPGGPGAPGPEIGPPEVQIAAVSPDLQLQCPMIYLFHLISVSGLRRQHTVACH